MNKNIDVPFLNYDGRDSGREFRKWLKENSTVFKDYNFEGSGVTAITDILGQYLMQDAFIANVSYNESSLLRSKVWVNKASISSSKGYTPHKKLGARVHCDILVNSTTNVTLEPRGYIFIGHKENNTIPFVSLKKQVSIKQTDEIQLFKDVELVEGTWENFSYQVKDLGFPRYTIPEKDVDISTIKVYVYPSGSKSGVEYQRIQHISDIYNSGYILVLGSDNKYHIVFGDDKIGNKPGLGSTIYVEYVKSLGEEGNSINNISLTTPIEGKSVNRIKANYNSYGGSNLESLDSIEMNSVMNSSFIEGSIYYKNLLKTKFPQLTDIIIIDGEDFSPIRYGVVYVYVTIGNENVLPLLKSQIIKTLEKYKLTPCIFVLNDPKLIEIDVYFDIDVDKNLYEDNIEVKEYITSSIIEYSKLNYGKISSSFYPTELIHHILSTVKHIKINDSSYVYKVPLYNENPGVNSKYIIDIPNNIQVSTIRYNNSVIDITKNQYLNNEMEFHPETNSVTLYKKHVDHNHIFISSDDDASYIQTQNEWIPVIKNINVEV